MTAATLHLPLKGVYFDQIKSGAKLEEYRLCTPYWAKRLEGRSYDQIALTRGYPAKGDTSRRMSRPWRGVRKTTITHPHFGPDPVTVYAIRVNPLEGQP
ncbi:ASCH domain-containing protein [Sulfitobacter sp. 1A16787]|uniref:ASCH domain-containing protein n=1 Tax=Sulfitobacter sp. 1A16787 TaxID=3368571 RepID=UPI0037459885